VGQRCKEGRNRRGKGVNEGTHILQAHEVAAKGLDMSVLVGKGILRVGKLRDNLLSRGCSRAGKTAIDLIIQFSHN